MEPQASFDAPTIFINLKQVNPQITILSSAGHFEVKGYFCPCRKVPVYVWVLPEAKHRDYFTMKCINEIVTKYVSVQTTTQEISTQIGSQK